MPKLSADARWRIFISHTDKTIGKEIADAIDEAGGSSDPRPPNGPAGGDLSGTYPNPAVSKIATNPVDQTAPTNGDVLTYSGGVWGHTPPAASLPLGIVVYQTAAVQNLTSSTTQQLAPSVTLHRFICAAGSVALSGVPTVSWGTPQVGQLLILMNVGSPGTGHLTINRGAAQEIALSNANTRIDEGGSMALIWSGTAWIETTHTQATS